MVWKFLQVTKPSDVFIETNIIMGFLRVLMWGGGGCLALGASTKVAQSENVFRLVLQYTQYDL